MRALVTGGGGFLGLYVVEQLIARGDSVRVLCRGDYPNLRALGVEIIRGDVRDAAAVAAACEGCEVVFHTAAVSGIWGTWNHFYSINTQGTLNVLAGCRQSRVSRLVYTSSPSVVFDGRDHLNADESLPYPSRFLCHYPHTKMLAERAVLEANGQDGLCTVSLRPHLIWGPRDNHLIPRLIRRARQGRLARVGNGKNLVSMVYVENAAHAQLLASDCLTFDSPLAGKAYFINEPEPVSLWTWVDELLSRGGLPGVRRGVPLRLAYGAGALLEATYAMLRRTDEPPMTRFLALQLGRHHTYSIDRARADFGYGPLVSVADGMDRLTPQLRQLASS